MNTPNFKEVSALNENQGTLRKFIKELRSEQGWKSSAGKDNEVIFLIAFMVSMVSLFIFGASGGIRFYPFFLPFVWGFAGFFYYCVRASGEGESIKELDLAIDVIDKSIKRGRVGIEKKSDTYFDLVGVYHNDLLDEDTSDYISLSDTDVRKLYDMLDGNGVFANTNFKTGPEFPVSTLEIPIDFSK